MKDGITKEKGAFDGTRLREQRKRVGLTQKELAQAAGVNQSAVCDYERGRSSPQCETLARMTTVLHTSADYLLGLTDDAAPLSASCVLDSRERELMEVFRSLTYGQRERAVGFLLGSRENSLAASGNGSRHSKNEKG